MMIEAGYILSGGNLFWIGSHFNIIVILILDLKLRDSWLDHIVVILSLLS
jgi:hypothetical protein